MTCEEADLQLEERDTEPETSAIELDGASEGKDADWLVDLWNLKGSR